MKRFFILLVFVNLTAVGPKVFAQSTGTTPAPGATHSYFITPGNSANTLLWSVTKGDLDTPAGSDVEIDAPGAATTDITWASTVQVGNWYYVHITETDEDGCPNIKVLPVQITTNPFYLEIAAANATQCYDNAVAVSLVNPSTVNYDHGTATVIFTVTPAGLSSSYSGYSFDLNLDAPAGFDYTTTPVAFSLNAAIDESGTVTVNDNSEVTITYTIDNTNVYTNASDADAQDFTVTATISGGKAVNGVYDNGTGDKNDATSITRPHTSGIGTN
jgi:hypothetical protein